MGPIRRHYHTLVSTNNKLYAVCGQTLDWPIVEVDLQTFESERLRLDQSETSLPRIDLHTSHFYNNQILIVGGRTHSSQQGFAYSETIFSVDILTGKVSIFESLPKSVGGHVSFLVDNRYIVILGGTDGYEILAECWRYDIVTAIWKKLVKFEKDLDQ